MLIELGDLCRGLRGGSLPLGDKAAAELLDLWPRVRGEEGRDGDETDETDEADEAVFSRVNECASLFVDCGNGGSPSIISLSELLLGEYAMVYQALMSPALDQLIQNGFAEL